MKAMVLTGPNRPFELRQVPDPVAAPGEAVARVFTCGSGLTIQHVKAGRRKAEFPRIIGHEITGEIVETGAGVTSLKVGRSRHRLFLPELRTVPLVPVEPRAPVPALRRQCRHRVRRRLCRVHEAAGAPLHQAARRRSLARSSGRDRRRHRRAGDALQGARPCPRQHRAKRSRCSVPAAASASTS